MAAHKTLSCSADEVEMYQEHHPFNIFCLEELYTVAPVCVSLWLSKRERQRVTVNASWEKKYSIEFVIKCSVLDTVCHWIKPAASLKTQVKFLCVVSPTPGRMRGGHQIKNPAYVDRVLPVGNKTEVKNLVVKASQVEHPAIQKRHKTPTHNTWPAYYSTHSTQHI